MRDEELIEESTDTENTKLKKIEQFILNVQLSINKKIGPEPEVKIWFTLMPIEITLLLAFVLTVLPHIMTSKGVAESMAIIFEVFIPLFFVIYSITLVVISLMKIKSGSKNNFYSSSLYLCLVFVFSIIGLIINQSILNGTLIYENFNNTYIFSCILLIIDVYYLTSQIKNIVLLMVGEYTREEAS